LLDFVRERDAPCPRCGYNLRNLTGVVCPECEERLELRVGVQRFRIVWLLIGLAPGTFCGIFGGILAIVIPVLIIKEGLPASIPPGAYALALFFALSGFSTLVGSFWSRRFLRLSRAGQMGIVGVIWAVHLIPFFLFLLVI